MGCKVGANIMFRLGELDVWQRQIVVPFFPQNIPVQIRNYS